MKILLIVFHVCVVFFSASAQYQYPVSKTVDSSDTYWGVTIKDLYHWLEYLKDSSVLDWLAKIQGQDLLIG